MPNWTDNKLYVEGDRKDVAKFLKHMGEGFDFEQVIPVPEGVDEYNWCWDNWNTKWNACEVERDIEHYSHGKFTTVEYRFQTAWSPPEKVVEKLRKDWPKLEIHGGYVGEGYEFCGNF